MTEWEKKGKGEPAGTADDRNRELDDFWNVEELLPNRPVRRPPPPPRPTPAAVEIELPTRDASPKRGVATPNSASAPVTAAPLTVTASAGSERSSAADTRDYSRPMPEPRPAPVPTPTPTAAPAATTDASVHYVPPHKRNEMNASEPLVEYVPDGVLLHRVRVFGWQANYHYFDSFVEDAIRYHAMEPPESAEKTTFFSYFPQYVQMNRRTERWYLFWREQARRGQYLDTDYAYVLLYLFELINLPVTAPAEARERRDRMAELWMAYRRAFPQLDHYMCEWLCDYCLIHGLAAPVELLSPALDVIIQESRLKEFYLSSAVRLPEGGDGAADPTALQTARILMRHCCQYDYRKSKFAGGDHKDLFDKTIPAAIAHVLPLLLGANGQGSAAGPVITMLDSTVTRDAFVGALCSYRNKRRIEVSYTSFSRSHELRFLMGDMVKHVENRLRSWIGVRSRLSVMSLPIPLRDALDAYLAPLEPPKSAAPVRKKEVPRPAYEALYDLPRKEVSLTDAAAIEAQSWETTRILVEAFAEESEDPPTALEPAHPTPPPKAASPAPIPTVMEQASPQAPSLSSAGESTPLTPYASFIKAALDGDSAALGKAAKALGKMPDAIADEINALSADSEIGDIILEDDGMGGYTVIEDYRDAVAEMIKDG